MQSHTSHLVSRISYLVSRLPLYALICLATLASVGLAQEAATLPKKLVSTDDANEVSVLPFPYIAEITANDVYIRSGPGTQYYPCGKLNKADKVKVVGSQFSWSQIVPPAGSFSWISKQYVSIDRNNPAIGIVTADAVRVYAGSERIKPMRSTTSQGKLNIGDKVRLMDEEKDDYYKIVPPSFAYLWVSTVYTKPFGPVGEVPPTVEPTHRTGRVKPKTEAEISTVVPTTVSVEAKKLKEYYALEKQIETERAKPMAQQNYANIKKALVELAGDKDAGKAARYAEFAIKQIERFELALAVSKEVQLQNAQLQQIRAKIDKAHTTRLAEVQELGRFAVIGWLQTSSIYYGTGVELKRYRIVDESGKIICYASPSGPASKMDLSKLIDHKVGLVGTIQPHPQTAGALVQFTEIAELK